MSNCNLRIENPTHIGVIPINHDIKTIYKFFSGVNCDIIIKAAPGTYSNVGSKGPVLSRGVPDCNRKFKPEYGDRLVSHDDITVDIEIRDYCHSTLLKKFGDILSNVQESSSFKVDIEGITDANKLTEVQKENGPYYNIKIHMRLSDLRHHLDELSDISWYLS